MSFIFGGDTGQSYEDLQRRRKIAQQLARGNSNPRNVAEGVGSAAKSVIGALLDRKMGERENKMRGEFNEQYAQAVPEQMRGVADLYGSPMATDGQRKVLASLMKGIPGYRRGTNFAPGGMAVVGEDGPEVVELPRGSRVNPNPMTQVYDEYDRGGPAERLMPKPEGYMDAPEPDEYLRQELGDQMFQQYQRMSPQQRMDFFNDPANGFVPEAPMDPREGMQFEAQANPQSRFDDARSYQTADLDAFKMMQIDPQYGDIVEHEANSTEGRKLQLLRRAMFADAALEDPRLAKAMTRMDNNVAGRLGAVGRLYTDDNYELGKLMAEQFSSAILRGDSGAATPDNEVARYMRQYFPLPNETNEQLAAKKAMRREEIRALMQSLPADARPAAQQIEQEIEMLRQQSDVPDGSLMGNADISDEDKEFLKSLGLE